MRLYTIINENKQEEVLVSCDGGMTGFALSDLLPGCSGINDLLSIDPVKGPDFLFRKGPFSDFADSKASSRNQLPDSVPLSGKKLAAPIPEPLQDVICLGINYDEHAREAGRFSDEAFGGDRPYTIYFSKRVTRAPGSGDPIPSYPGLVDSLDYECELGVVLGKTVRDVSKEEALDAVFGYTIINDFSARNLQTRHKQWYKGKSLDGHTPMGPCIVTADEFGDPQNKNIRCYVNGSLRQNSNTRYMIQTVAGAISELSQGMTLKAGTIIATGTPAGVGMGMQPPCFLKQGDVVTCEIEGIGILENTVI